jgi:hypothetical protein
LSAGTHVITAAYSGDATFMPGSGSMRQVVNAISPNYTLSATPTNTAIRAGQSAAVTVTATPVGDFAGTINFSCGPLPAGLSCQFSPSSLMLNNGQAASTTLAIADSPTLVGHSTPAEHVPGGGFPLWASFASGLFGLITVEGVSQRKRRQIVAIAVWMVLALAMIALTGCGLTPTPTTSSRIIQVIATGTTSSGSMIQQQVNITVTLQH